VPPGARLASYARLLAETGIPDDELRLVIDRFRADDCSFLVPSISAEPTLKGGTRVDVGHEALLRRWERISSEDRQDIGEEGRRPGWLWAEEDDGALYRAWLTLGPYGRLPEVERHWQSWCSRPRTAAWAERYGGHLPQIEQLFRDNLAALKDEQDKREEERKRTEREHRRRRINRNILFGAALSLGIAAIAILTSILTYQRATEAIKQQTKAEAGRLEAEEAGAAEAALRRSDDALRFLEGGREALLRGAIDDAAIFLAAAYADSPENHALQILLGKVHDELSIRGDAIHTHDGMVSDMQFSPNGKWIATGGADGLTKVWDRTGRLVHIFGDQNDLITAVRFDPTGRHLVTTSRDGSARIRSLDGITLASAPPPIDLKGHADRINSAEFSRDGSRVLTASNDGSARVWEATTGRLLLELSGNQGEVTGAAFAVNDTVIVSCASDGTLRIWDAASGKQLNGVRGSKNPLVRLAVEPSGRYAAAGANDGLILIYDLAENKTVAARIEQHGSINALAFDAAGHRLVSASDDGTALVWDVGTGVPLSILATRREARLDVDSEPRTKRKALLAAGFDRLGDVITTTSRDGSVSFWNPDGTAIAGLRGHRGEAFVLAFAPDGELSATGGADGNIFFWHANTGLIAADARHAGAVESIAFDPGGQRIVTGSRDGTAAVWQLGDGLAKIATLLHAPGEAWVTSANFDDKGELIVTAGGNDVAKIWDVRGATANAPIEPVAPTATIQADASGKRLVDAMFLPGGSRVIAGQRGAVGVPDDVNTDHWIVWSMDGHVSETEPYWLSGIRKLELSRNGHFVLAFNESGDANVSFIEGNRSYSAWRSVAEAALSKGHFFYALGYTDGRIDIKTLLGEQSQQIRAHQGRVTALAFSDDDRFLASAGSDDLVAKIWDTHKKWDIHSDSLVATLAGHTGAVASLEFSRDGALVLTTSQDGTAKLWDRETGVLIESISAGSSSVRRASFTPDGIGIVIGAEDGRLYLWRLRMQELDPVKTEQDVLKMVNRGDTEGHASDPVLVQALEALRGMAEGPEAAAHREAARRIEMGLAAAAANEPTRAADNLLPIVLDGAGDSGVRLAAAAVANRFKALRMTLRPSTESARIERVAFAESGQKLVAGSFDMTAKVWDVATGRLLYTLGGFNSPVTNLWTQRNGNLAVASGLGDREARVWDLDTGQERYRRDLGGSVVNVVYFSDDGSRLVARNSTNIRVFNAADGTVVFESRDMEPVVSSAISADGKQLVLATKRSVRIVPLDSRGNPVVIDTASGANDAPISLVRFDSAHNRVLTLHSNVARLWDGRDKHLIQEFAAPVIQEFTAMVPLYDVEFGHTGDIVLATAAESAFLWRIGEAAPRRFSGPFNSNFNLLSDDDRRLFTGSGHGSEAAIWDLSASRLLAEFAGTDGDWVAADITPDSRLLGTAGDDGIVHLWDTTAGEPLETSFDQGDKIVDFSSDSLGKKILTRSGIAGDLVGTEQHSNSGTVKIWNVEGKHLLWTYQQPISEGIIQNARISSDGSSVILIFSRPRVTNDNNSSQKTVPDQDARPDQSAPNPQLSKQVQGIEASKPEGIEPSKFGWAIRVLNAEDGSARHEYESDQAPALSPSGRYLVLRDGNGRISRVDLTDWSSVEWSIGVDNLASLRFGKNDDLLIAETVNRDVTIWLKEPTRFLRIRIPEAAVVNGVLSPDSKRLVTFGHRVNPTVWDPATGELVAVLTGHRGDVVDAEFVPNGGGLLTTGADGTLKLWSVEDGKPMLSLGGEAERLAAGRFSPDGRYIVSTSEAGRLKVWDRSGTAVLGFPTANSYRVAPIVLGNLSLLAADGDKVVLYHVDDLPSAENLRQLVERLGIPTSSQRPSASAAQ